MKKKKKKDYSLRILNAEQGTFTPIVLPANSGMSRESQKFYGKLSSKISEKCCQPYHRRKRKNIVFEESVGSAEGIPRARKI